MRYIVILRSLRISAHGAFYVAKTPKNNSFDHSANFKRSLYSFCNY